MSYISPMPHQYRCAFFSWTPARSPAPSAVSQAASILLRSASEENMLPYGSSQVDIGDCYFCPYEERVKTLQAAVQALSSHFDHLIAQTNQERNRYCSVYQLPIEILSFILVLSCESPAKPTMTDAARFRRVSKYFRDAIAATAAFWTDVQIGHPLAQEALVRSRGLLIDINTPKNQGIRLSAFLGGRDPLVEGLAANSSRWRSLCFVGHPTPVEMGLLRCQAPQLRELYLDFQCSLYGTLPQQPIIDPGEGQPLRHLCLNSVRLPWSTRLRQLKTLQLYSIEAPPGLEELYSMLRSSTQLEQLVLSTLGWNAAQEQRLDARLAEPITFPHLAEITLFDLHVQLTDFLCSVVRAPNTESLVVGSAPVEMLSLQNTKWAPFHNTLAGCMGNLSCVDIDIDADRGAISISTAQRSSRVPSPSPKWKQPEVAQSFEMDCFGDNVLLGFPMVADFLAENGDGIDFCLYVAPIHWDPSEDEVDAILRGLTTLTGVVDLDIRCFPGGAQVVRHLSVEYENDIGAPAWVCPWLTKLNVEDVPNINQNDWKALLKARGPGRTSLLSGQDSPVRIRNLQHNVKIIYGP